MTLTSPAIAGIVVSRDVSDVSVTVYRDPDRGKGPMDRRWPGGYALVTETRTIILPAGESTVRFEGVAEGLLPETAIVSGLPDGVREKNRDARLLSPAGLVDAYLKRTVHLRRTNLKTGKIIEQDAVIQAGPNGGVVLRTSDGFEALGCAGLPERMMYDGVPADVSAKPTLSILATSDRPMTATIQLTYMAEGFDWSASYVARMDQGGKTLGLFAWLTVANGGVTSFPDARMQVVAGFPHKEANAPPLRTPDPALHLRCWPTDITSTHPRYVFTRLPWPENEEMYEAASDIVVTGSKRGMRLMRMAAPAEAPPPPPPAPVIAGQEDLGDLKLYRVPMRVTVAAQSQKQVAMIDQPKASFARIYSARVGSVRRGPQPMPFLLRGKNVKERGLGVPLPAGGVALFEPVSGESLLVGEDELADRAIGEEVEIAVGKSPDVQWRLTRVNEKDRRQGWRVDITNARPVPIRAEIIIPYDLAEKPPGLERGRGGWKLPVDVAANASATVQYRLKMETRP